MTSALEKSFHGEFPQIWWEEVSTAQAPEWEIFPQAAQKGEVILSKRNELGILSNFAPTPFHFRGQKYASLEGFWQMMKFPEGDSDERKNPSVQWSHTRAEVSLLAGREAKTLGDQASANMKTLDLDWVTFEGRKIKYHEIAKGEFYQLIYQAMQAKLEQNPEVRNILLKTKSLRLLPDHTQEPNCPPAWKYFEIWMEIRQQL